MQNPELRPLGAGEMLDRAITLFVRRFALIVAVLAVVSVPVIVLQAVVSPGAAHAFSDLATVLSTAGNAAASRRAAEALSRNNGMNPLTYLVTFATVMFRLLMWTAIISVVAAAYAGARTTVGDAYALALRRWVPQIVVALAFLVLGLFCAIPVFMLYLVVIVAVIALSALHQTIALVAVGIAGGVLVLAAAVVIGSLVFMAYELAAVALVTETAKPIQAFGIGLRRAFAPRMKRRTLAAGLVVVLVSQAGAIPLLALAAVAAAATHVDALYFAVFGVGNVLLDGLVASFVVVYAVDARIRRQGFDLVVAETPPPVPA